VSFGLRKFLEAGPDRHAMISAAMERLPEKKLGAPANGLGR
jgi:hypothetical protein